MTGRAEIALHYTGKLAAVAAEGLLEFLRPSDFDEDEAARFLDVLASAADGEAHPASAHPAELPAPPDLPRAGGAGTPTEAVTVQWIRNTDSFALRFAHNGFRYFMTPSQVFDLVAQLNGELGARTAAFAPF